MLGADVDFKFLDHSATKFVAWKHAFDGVLDNKLGFFSTHFAHADVAFAAHPTGVEHIALIGVLFARDLDLLCVDDYNEVARVCVRRVGRLVATTEHVGNFYGNAAECLVGSIDDEPGLSVVGFSS